MFPKEVCGISNIFSGFPLKGTVGVISSDSPCKDGISNLKRFPWKPLTDHGFQTYSN